MNNSGYYDFKELLPSGITINPTSGLMASAWLSQPPSARSQIEGDEKNYFVFCSRCLFFLFLFASRDCGLRDSLDRERKEWRKSWEELHPGGKKFEELCWLVGWMDAKSRHRQNQSSSSLNILYCSRAYKKMFVCVPLKE